jgi:hypothetical protein
MKTKAIKKVKAVKKVEAKKPVDKYFACFKKMFNDAGMDF